MAEITTAEQYNARLAEVQANLDKMSEDEKVAAWKELSAAAQRLTAEVQVREQQREEQALAERPLAITGKPPQQTPLGNFDETRMLVGEGIKHGTWQMYQGVKQLGQRISILANAMMQRPTIEGQLELNKMQMEYGKAQAKWRAEFVKDAKAIKADPTTALLVPMMTNVGIEAAVLGGPLSKVPTAMKRIAIEGGMAALGGAAQPTVTDTEFMTNILAAGTIGTGTASLFWAANLPVNTTRRTLQSGRTGVLESLPFTHPREAGLSSAAALEHEILARQFDPDLALAPSMLTQNDAIAQMERGVVGSPGSFKQQALRNIETTVFNRFARIADALNPSNVKFPTIITQARGAMQRGRDRLVQVRNQNWNDTMDKAVELTGGRVLREGKNIRRVGGAPVVEANTFFDTIDSLVDDAVDRKLLNEAQERDVMKFYNRWAERIDPTTGRMSAADTQQLLVELTDEMGGVGSAFGELKPNAAKRWASTLKDAVLTDLDNTIAKGDELERILLERAGAGKPRVRPSELEQGRAAQVSRLLKQAREDYSEASTAIDTFESKALWRVLHNLDQNNENWFDKVMKLPPDEMRELLDLADSAQPGLANALRGRVLMDAFERNRVITTNSASERYDLHEVLGDLAGKQKNGLSRYEALFPKGAYSTEEMELANKGLKVLELITAPSLRDQPVSWAARAREAAINVISRSPEFFGRWVFGEFQPMQLEKMLYSDGGIHALMEIGRFHGTNRLVLRTAGEGVRPRTLTQAIAQWSAIGTEMLAEEEAMEQARERRAQLLKMAQESPQMVK